MLDIAVANNDFYKYRILIKNMIQRLNSKTSVITLSKIKEMANFKDELINFSFSGEGQFPSKINIDFLRIYQKIFDSRIAFFENLEAIVYTKVGDDFEKFMLLLEEIRELVEKFDLYPGLSIIDLERIEEILDLLGI